MNSRIVIGDVHGSYKTLMALVAKLPVGVPITFAGDLVDRGPDSRKVVQFVIENGYDCVRGNHEQMMIEHVTNTAAPEYMNKWTDFTANGGLNTLNSYTGFPEDLKFHVDWMRALPVYVEYKDIKGENGRHLVVSHSAIGKVWDWSEERRKQMVKQFESHIMWDRDRFEDRPEIYNVFGHTPRPNPVLKSFYANIDTGACFKRDGNGMYGQLTALQYPEMIVTQQENCDI